MGFQAEKLNDISDHRRKTLSRVAGGQGREWDEGKEWNKEKEKKEKKREKKREFCWTMPVLVRENGMLIAGHGRLEAAKLEGITEVPTIVARGWTEAQCRAYAIADNRLTDSSRLERGIAAA